MVRGKHRTYLSDCRGNSRGTAHPNRGGDCLPGRVRTLVGCAADLPAEPVSAPSTSNAAFRIRRTVEPRLLLADDFDWVRNNLAKIVQLTEDDSFQTAVEALCTYMLASNDRMKVAQLWAGVEAIFDIEYELRYRLATLSAKLLGLTSVQSREVYADMKTLYGERSKIIHGKQLAKNKDAHDAKVREHILRMRSRLAQLLTKLISIGKVPTEEEFEEMLFEK